MSTNEKDFFNRLYRGLGYEYLTASELWKNGYEAYKMDADFGFDLLCCNQRERTFESTNDSKAYHFQVKSRKVEIEIQNSGAGNRRFADTKFFIKKSDVEKIIRDDKSFLVCYFVDTSTTEEKVLGSIILSSIHIKNMYEKNYTRNYKSFNKEITWFHESEFNSKYVYFDARYVTAADGTEIINGLLDKHEQNINDELEVAKKEMRPNRFNISNSFTPLKAWINKSKLQNRNSNPYINIFGYVDGDDQLKFDYKDKYSNIALFTELIEIESPMSGIEVIK